MTEESCPGRHYRCVGCEGSGYVPMMRQYIGTRFDTNEMISTSRCTSCEGRGFFCRNSPRCYPPRDPRT